MGYKIDIGSSGRDFLFGPFGDNILAGLSLQTALSSPSEAISRIGDLVPPVSGSNLASINAAAAGAYAGNLVLPEFTVINCRVAAVSASSGATLTGANVQLAEWGSVVNSGVDGICYLIDQIIAHRIDIGSVVVSGENGIGVVVTGVCDDIFVKVTKGTLAGPGDKMVFHESTSPSPVIYDFDVAEFQDINQTFIDYTPESNTDQALMDVMSVQAGQGFTTTGSTIARVQEGILTIDADILSADTVALVTGTGQFAMKAKAVDGDSIFRDDAVGNYKSVGIHLGDLLVEDRAVVLADVGSMVGDIVVGADAHLTITCSSHVGNLTINGRLDGIINGVYFGTYRQKPIEESVLNATSTSSQVPTGTDALLQVEFGPAQFGASDPVEISALGAITINQTDQYNLFLVFQYGRVGAAGGSSILLFRVLVNGVQFGLTRYAQLDNPNQAFPIEFTAPLNGVEGDIVTFEIWRDSSGFDAGELIPFTPALAGPLASSSASLSMTRNRLVQPV